jgi:hypothetical protein
VAALRHPEREAVRVDRRYRQGTPLERGAQVAFEVVRNEFDLWWPNLKKRIDEILVVQQVENETGYDCLYSTKDLARHMSKPQEVWVVNRRL